MPFVTEARFNATTPNETEPKIQKQQQTTLATTVWEEDFESGLGDWYADAGTWQVGTPTSGPDSAYGGDNVAATVLAGNYGSNASSRLISPSFQVPTASQNPRLRFWHWYSFARGDKGEVHIRTEGGEWEVLATYTVNSGNVWSRPRLDLSAYGGQQVQLALYILTDGSFFSIGWYVDEIEIETGPLTFNAFEGWEMGLSDWYVDAGTWEVGTPTSGPDSAYGGDNAAATVLAGNYSSSSSSRLISPIFQVPTINEKPRLRFWHWYSFARGDKGEVLIRPIGGDWESISISFSGNSGNVWSRPNLDLSSYAGQTVELAFQLTTDGSFFSLGWYIDELEIETGPMTFNISEDWESGLQDWYVDKGTWEIGPPTSGPGSAYNGENAAATVLRGNYSSNADSRLISPSFEVPGSSQDPRLRFWHWYSFVRGDKGEVHIRTEGGEWEVLATYTGNSGNVWSRPRLDLSAYGEQQVQLALYISTDGSFFSSGWYIDEIIIESDQAPPTTADADVMGPQDIPLVIQTDDIPFDDPGLSTLAHVQITSLPTMGALALDANDNDMLDSGEELTSNDIINKSDLDSDRLVWFVPDGEHGYRMDSFNFNVNNGMLSSTDATMYLTLNATEADLPGLAGQGSWQMLGNSWDSAPADLLEAIWTQGAAAGADVSGGSPNVLTYQESSTSYQPVTDLTQPLTDGQGLAVYVFADDDFDGTGDPWPKTLSTSGTSLGSPVDITVSNHDSDGTAGLSGDEGWNLVGNPFGTAIEVDSVIAALQDMGADPNSSVYIWDKTLQSGNGDWMVLTEGNQEKVAAFQAMFVRVQNAGMGQSAVTLQDRYRSESNVSLFKEDQPSHPAELKLMVAHQESGMEQAAAIRFSETASAGLDRDDVFNLWPMSDRYLGLSSRVGDQLLKVNNLPAGLQGEIEIPIEFAASESGPMRLTWQRYELPEDVYFMLKDNQTGRHIDLSSSGSYSFDNQQAAKKEAGDVLALGKISSKARELAPRFTLVVRRGNPIVDNKLETEMPIDFQLSQNYPNPFNPTTKIEYGLPEVSEVSLKVYDITGKEVATLVEQSKPAGTYSLSWDASQLASGLYIYRLITGKKTITKKMTLIK